ncbi:MAG: hypothetical protein Q8M22_08100 [Actinomycetota bacterium]|nr:hypothetical protein [Actinomycetota bacterium]
MSDEWNPNDPDATRVLYDLSMWSFDQQAELAAELADDDIPHTWDGAELVVPESHEAVADATITRVEERLGIVYSADAEAPHDNPAAQPIDIAEGVATTEYDLAEWPEGDRQSITRALTRQEIPYRWEDDLLLVPTDHEPVVESLMDLIESGEFAAHPDDLDDDDDTERLPFETLTTFFLAGERLQRNALDADGLEQLLAAVAVAEPDAPPYGVDLRLWKRTCELADELAGALVDDDEPDHDAAMTIAADLHDLLRPYI